MKWVAQKPVPRSNQSFSLNSYTLTRFRSLAGIGRAIPDVQHWEGPRERLPDAVQASRGSVEAPPNQGSWLHRIVNEGDVFQARPNGAWERNEISSGRGAGCWGLSDGGQGRVLARYGAKSLRLSDDGGVVDRAQAQVGRLTRPGTGAELRLWWQRVGRVWASGPVAVRKATW